MLTTTVVGSYPQPRWLVDHEKFKSNAVPRVRMHELWRVPEPPAMICQKGRREA